MRGNPIIAFFAVIAASAVLCLSAAGCCAGENSAVENKTILMYLEYNGADNPGDTIIECQYGSQIQGLPENLEKGGLGFWGWALDKDGNDKLSNGEICQFTKNFYAYAIWEGVVSTVFFDYGGATSGTDIISKKLTYNEPMGELPLPEKTGYYFMGWSLDQNGEEIVTEDTIFKKQVDCRLYAIWQAPYVEEKFPVQAALAILLVSIGAGAAIMRKGILRPCDKKYKRRIMRDTDS